MSVSGTGAGALVGGVIALGVQMVALRAARRDRKVDRRLVQQGLANSLLFKMTRIFSDFLITHQHIEQCCASAQERNSTGDLWQYVPPLANPPPLVHFTSDEMGMLLGLKDNDVFNSVVSMDEVHNALVETVKLYKELRLALGERLPAPTAWQGEMLMGALTREQLAALRPDMINVESVIRQLRIGAANEARVSGEVLDRLSALLRERLGLTFRFERQQVEEAPETGPPQVAFSSLAAWSSSLKANFNSSSLPSIILSSSVEQGHHALAAANVGTRERKGQDRLELG